MMKNYSWQEVEKLIKRYIDKGGSAIQLREGVLGSGDWILTSDTLYSFVIKEIFVTSWTSSHTVRRYKTLPKKYIQR